MKRLHVVEVLWRQYDDGKPSRAVGYYLGEVKSDILLSHEWDPTMSIHQICFNIPKSRVIEIKTIVIMDAAK